MSNRRDTSPKGPYSERRMDRTDEPFPAIQKQLERLVQDAGLHAAVLASSDGLTIASPNTKYPDDMVSALAGFTNKLKEYAEKSVFKEPVTDLTVTGQTGTTFHCRFFQLMGQMVSLAVVTPAGFPQEEILSRGVSGILRIVERHYLQHGID